MEMKLEKTELCGLVTHRKLLDWKTSIDLNATQNAKLKVLYILNTLLWRIFLLLYRENGITFITKVSASLTHLADVMDQILFKSNILLY
jgi:hypothetical protein